MKSSNTQKMQINKERQTWQDFFKNVKNANSVKDVADAADTLTKSLKSIYTNEAESARASHLMNYMNEALTKINAYLKHAKDYYKTDKEKSGFDTKKFYDEGYELIELLIKINKQSKKIYGEDIINQSCLNQIVINDWGSTPFQYDAAKVEFTGALKAMGDKVSDLNQLAQRTRNRDQKFFEELKNFKNKVKSLRYSSWKETTKDLQKIDTSLHTLLKHFYYNDSLFSMDNLKNKIYSRSVYNKLAALVLPNNK